MYHIKVQLQKSGLIQFTCKFVQIAVTIFAYI